MPVYEYTGLNNSGKTLKGIIDADSAVAARQKLRGSGIFPVEVKEALSRPSVQQVASPLGFANPTFLRYDCNITTI